MKKQYAFHDNCRERLFSGIDIMYQAVSSTLGPHGRTVLIERAFNMTEPTKDGVTVAEEVYCEDKWQNMGAQLVREASQRANNEAGDATTTAVVLAYNLAKEGMLEVNKRANVYQISKGMKIACDAVVKELEKIAKKIESEEDFRKVAIVSTQDEEIGAIIAKTFVEAGKHGSIVLARNEKPGIIAEKTEGISFDKGWDSKEAYKLFLTDLRNKRCIAEDCPILVVEDKIENDSQLLPIMQKLVQDKLSTHEKLSDRYGWPFSTRKLVVVCDAFGGSAISLMINNSQWNQERKTPPFHLIFIEAPSYGRHKVEIMKDIAAVTGATFISQQQGGRRIEHATMADIGRAKSVIIESKKTTIVSEMHTGDWGEGVKQRIDEQITLLKSEIEDMPSDHVDKPELERRLATLTDGVSVLKVGAESENERNELKRRVEDGVRAVKSAREEGVTPGCGVALLQCVKVVEDLMKKAQNNDQRRGMDIMRKALHSVSLRLLEVAYIEDFNAEKYDHEKNPSTAHVYRSHLVEKMKKEGKGYDFNNDCLADMMEIGIYDAKKAIRVALESAVSVASTFLKVDCAIGHVDESDQFFEFLKSKLLT